MTGFLGADTEQVTTFAERAESSAEVLGERAAALAALLAQVDWQGQDAEDFRSHWSGTVQPGIEQCAEELRQRGGELRQHAEEQESTSDPATESGGGGSTGGGSTTGGGTGSEPPLRMVPTPVREQEHRLIRTADRDTIAGETSYLIGHVPRIATPDHEIAVCANLETLQRGGEIGNLIDVTIPTPITPTIPYVPVPDVQIPTPITPTIPYVPVPDVQIPTPPTLDVKIDDNRA